MAISGDSRDVWIRGSSGKRKTGTRSTGVRRQPADRPRKTRDRGRVLDDDDAASESDAEEEESLEDEGSREADHEFVSAEDEDDASAGSARGMSADEAEDAAQYLHPLIRQFAVDDDEPSESGSVRPRAVIGPDNRKLVGSVEKFPFRAICSLKLAKSARHPQVGTGFLVGKNLVLTAGHNLCHNEKLGSGYVDSVTVFVGRNGEARYLDSVQVSERDRLRVSRAWRNQKDPLLDWGLIILPNEFGVKYGAFTLGPWGDDELRGSLFNVVGYPASQTTKTRVPYQMWADAGEIAKTTPSTLRYLMDTSGGQSGAPLFAWREPDAFVVGVHNYGNSNYNQATRITQEIATAVLQVEGARFFEET